MCQMLLLQIQPHLLPKLHRMEADRALSPWRDLSWLTPCTQQVGLATGPLPQVWSHSTFGFPAVS